MSITVEQDIDLYESDIQKIRAVGIAIKGLEGTRRDPEVVAVEISERFAEAGYRADIMLGVSEQSDGENLYQFHVRLVGRLEPGSAGTEFDHERQAREIRAAMGVPLEGIKDDPSKVSRG